jgi:hypothetical protein
MRKVQKPWTRESYSNKECETQRAVDAIAPFYVVWKVPVRLDSL